MVRKKKKQGGDEHMCPKGVAVYNSKDTTPGGPGRTFGGFANAVVRLLSLFFLLLLFFLSDHDKDKKNNKHLYCIIYIYMQIASTIHDDMLLYTVLFCSRRLLIRVFA